jgi:ribosome maturation factor RimP
MSDRVPNLAPIVSMIGHPHARLIELISPLVFPLGYRIIDLEIQSHRQKILRIFIDYLEDPLESAQGDEKIGTHKIEPGEIAPGKVGPNKVGSSKIGPAEIGPAKIGIEDCVRVSKALDEPLDQIPEVGSLLSGTYELEVSSPGMNRALRLPGDFKKFVGSRVRVHVYRPLTGEELNNVNYQTANPKQKNFLGILSGFQESKVVLSLSLGEKKSKKESRPVKQTGTKKKDSLPTNSEEETVMNEKIIMIPLPLISKANLEPEFNFEGSDERE